VRILAALLCLAGTASAEDMTFRMDVSGVYQAYDSAGNVLPLADGKCQKLDTAVAYAATNNHQFRALGGGGSATYASPRLTATILGIGHQWKKVVTT